LKPPWQPWQGPDQWVVAAARHPWLLGIRGLWAITPGAARPARTFSRLPPATPGLVWPPALELVEGHDYEQLRITAQQPFQLRGSRLLEATAAAAGVQRLGARGPRAPPLEQGGF